MTPPIGYTEMKDSGTEWLGFIPNDWTVSKIASLYVLRNEKVSDKDYPPLSVTMKGILPQLATAAKTDDGDNRKLVRTGDFAINSRSDRRGSCGISSYDGSVSLINTVLTPRADMHPGYYNWLFHTSLFADEFYRWGHGIVDDLWTTRWQEMKRILVTVPPHAEQSAIAAYLDTQCAKIDEIIAEAKASIEEYKQWKASVIYEAVTKGLDPDVEMKDSGIEWIGEIPQSWITARLKKVLLANDGGVWGNDPIGNGQDKIVIRSTEQTVDGKWNIETPALRDLSEMSFENSRILPGDLLITKSSGSALHIGKTTLADNYFATHEAYFSNFIQRIRVSIEPKFMWYILNSDIARHQFVYLQNSTSGIGNINSENIRNIIIPLPSITEQSTIVAHLDIRCAKIDELISEKQTLITDLETYKKSLIYEVVTGKRRVC